MPEDTAAESQDVLQDVHSCMRRTAVRSMTIPQLPEIPQIRMYPVENPQRQKIIYTRTVCSGNMAMKIISVHLTVSSQERCLVAVRQTGQELLIRSR